MLRPTLMLMVLLLCGAALQSADAQPVVYLVRHAEKLDDSKDPILSTVGEARAARLAAMLKSSGVKFIFTTQYQRTMQTAEPLARALALTPVVHPGGDTEGLVRRIRALGTDDTVLVVGHSNTVPQILKALGHTNEIRIDDTEFDNLYVFVPKAAGASTLINIKY